jgi:peptide deformylase
MALPIVRYNQPVLRRKGQKVTAFDSALAALAREMIATMKSAEGIGLAAQQVGQALQVCVVDLRAAKKDFQWVLDGARPPLDLFMPLVLVNPVIAVSRGTDDYVFEEGCLSFPGIRGDIVRPDAISVSFQDDTGVPHVLACDGLLARCIQHEVDHLNGVLFIDRMEPDVRARLDPEIKALAKETKAAAKG